MKEIIAATRTFRRFDGKHEIDLAVLKDMIELGRLGGSARNCQPWQYMAVNSRSGCQAIFPMLGWAGYLADWKGPSPEERPTAYILCMLNTQWLKGSVKEAYFDLGVSTQNMLLGARQLGLGGCRIAAFSPRLNTRFSPAEHLELHLVIALGKPVEEVVLEEVADDNIQYWRDGNMVHHVPKRKLEDILLSPKDVN